MSQNSRQYEKEMTTSYSYSMRDSNNGNFLCIILSDLDSNTLTKKIKLEANKVEARSPSRVQNNKMREFKQNFEDEHKSVISDDALGMFVILNLAFLEIHNRKECKNKDHDNSDVSRLTLEMRSFDM